MTLATVETQLRLLKRDLHAVPPHRQEQLCRVYDRSRNNRGWRYHVDHFTGLPFAHKFNRRDGVHSFVWHPDIAQHYRDHLVKRYEATLATA